MEQDEYIAKAMFRADQREQLRYARDEGRKETKEEILDFIRKGYNLSDIEKLLQR
jgi:hypothetical protein